MNFLYLFTGIFFRMEMSLEWNISKHFLPAYIFGIWNSRIFWMEILNFRIVKSPPIICWMEILIYGKEKKSGKENLHPTHDGWKFYLPEIKKIPDCKISIQHIMDVNFTIPNFFYAR